MNAIQIKNQEATDSRPARLKAIWGNQCLIMERLDTMPIDEQATILAQRFLTKKKIPNAILTGRGTLPNGDFVATIGEL